MLCSIIFLYKHIEYTRREANVNLNNQLE